MAVSWCPVLGFEGHYEVSDDGEVRSIKRKPIILAPRYDRTGYVRAALFLDGKYNIRLVHRLVAAVFLPPQPTPLHEINHIDCNKANNRADNLEWCTRSENGFHAYANGRSTPRKGTLHGMSKLTEADVLEIKSLLGTMTQREIAARFGVLQPQIHRIATGKRWAHLK